MGRKKNNPMQPPQGLPKKIRTKALSITLPATLIEKLNQLEVSGHGVNTSRAIRYILEEYFAVAGDTIIPTIAPDEALYPVELLAKIIGVGKITIRNRAAKGDFKIVHILNTEFVQMNKDDNILDN